MTGMFRLADFVKYLKDHKLNGASQATIGELLGKPQAYVSLIAKGQRPFLDEYLKALIDYYGEELVMRFYSPEESVEIDTENKPDCDKDTLNRLLSMIDTRDQMLIKSQEQIDRLISIIEKQQE